MTWEVRQVEFEGLEPLRRVARRERLSWKTSSDTLWWGLYLAGDDEVVGCGGLVWIRKDHSIGRLKAALIAPEWRGQGGYRPLVEARVAFAWAEGAVELQTITRTPSRFAKWGWQHVDGQPPPVMRLCNLVPAELQHPPETMGA